MTSFELSLSKTSTLCLDFHTDQDDFEQATNFLYIYIRLCYQTEHKQAYDLSNSEDNYSGYWSYKDMKKNSIPENLEHGLEDLRKDKSIEFCSVGELTTYDPKDEVTKPHAFKPNWIFLIRNSGDFVYELELITENGEKILTQVVNGDFQYNVNEDLNSVTWLGNIYSEDAQKIAYNFRFFDNKASVNLKFVVVVTVMQHQQKKNLKEIIEKNNNDWEQFYMQSREDDLNGEETDYLKYKKSNKLRLEFPIDSPTGIFHKSIDLDNPENIVETPTFIPETPTFFGKPVQVETPIEKQSPEKIEDSNPLHITELLNIEKPVVNPPTEKIDGSNPLHITELLNITQFTQARCLDRTFVNNNNTIEVYRTNPHLKADRQMEYLTNQPKLVNFDKEEFKPSKIFLQEQDTRLVMADKDTPNLYYYDVETGQLTSQIENKFVLNDICPYEKTSEFTPKQEFFGVSAQNIIHFDPRLPKGIVKNKKYKTNYEFNTINSATNGNVSVGSKYGDIRLINKVGDKSATNLQPSMLGDCINGLDTSKDGSWILATCDKYLQLFPTKQQGNDGFAATFQKIYKPSPRVLRIHPKALAKFNIQKLQFLSAKFDDKKDCEEGYVTASSGPFMAIWSMKSIMKGNCVTNVVKKLTGDIVGSEFKWDSHAILTAMRNGLSVQKTRTVDLPTS